MSRRAPFDSRAARDLNPRQRLAERQRTPDEVCRHAAGLLESLAANSSEARAAAEELRLLAKAIVRAMAADTSERRRQAETIFSGGR